MRTVLRQKHSLDYGQNISVKCDEVNRSVNVFIDFNLCIKIK